MLGDFPGEIEGKDIHLMRDGDEGYTYPWSICGDEKGRLWIRGDRPYFVNPRVNAHLRIECIRGKIFAYQDTLGKYKIDNRGKPMNTWHPIQINWK